MKGRMEQYYPFKSKAAANRDLKYLQSLGAKNLQIKQKGTKWAVFRPMLRRRQ